jgi:hypothetical protein
MRGTGGDRHKEHDTRASHRNNLPRRALTFGAHQWGTVGPHGPVKHTPLIHGWPASASHELPHAPQCLMSVRRLISHPSAQSPLQLAMAAGHSSSQVPFRQNVITPSTVGHALLHAPQLFGSMSSEARSASRRTSHWRACAREGGRRWVGFGGLREDEVCVLVIAFDEPERAGADPERVLLSEHLHARRIERGEARFEGLVLDVLDDGLEAIDRGSDTRSGGACAPWLRSAPSTPYSSPASLEKGEHRREDLRDRTARSCPG